MSKAIGVDISGVVEWHVKGNTLDYNTLCGLDANDPAIGHNGTVEPKRGQKITCEECKNMFNLFRDLKLRISDFD